MEIRVRFTEPLVSCSRFSIEEQIEQWLTDAGEILGGGAATDGSWAHIDLMVPDRTVAQAGLPKLVDELRRVLQLAKVPASTKIIVFESDEVSQEYSVY